MLALLISLSFTFDSIPSPQVAGDSFRVTISATDTSTLERYLLIMPPEYNLEICGTNDNIINFKDGIWQGWIRVLNTADSVNICCSDIDNEELFLSNQFKVTGKITLSQLRQTQTTNDSIYIYPNPLRTEHTSTSINYYLNTDAHVSIIIFDKFGNLVFKSETDELGGPSNFEWNGTDNNGNRVFSGVYIVCVKATNQTQTVAQYAGKIAVIR